MPLWECMTCHVLLAKGFICLSAFELIGRLKPLKANPIKKRGLMASHLVVLVIGLL